MAPADLATLSLLDPDQGFCPSGHRCRLVDPVGRRQCHEGEYQGFALICWDITERAIEVAQDAGADRLVIDWAHSFLSEAR